MANEGRDMPVSWRGTLVVFSREKEEEPMNSGCGTPDPERATLVQISKSIEIREVTLGVPFSFEGVADERIICILFGIVFSMFLI
ncbi:hypothetical protein AHAS_Ahas05G0163700 [Arachis hypogaea]